MYQWCCSIRVTQTLKKTVKFPPFNLTNFCNTISSSNFLRNWDFLSSVTSKNICNMYPIHYVAFARKSKSPYILPSVTLLSLLLPFSLKIRLFCVFLQGKAKQTEIANQIKLSIKVQKSKLWKFLRIWWCVSNWIFPSFLSTEERNKCKKTTEERKSLFSDFADVTFSRVFSSFPTF